MPDDAPPTLGQTDLLRTLPSALNAPPMLTQPGVETLQAPTTVPSDTTFPKPNFTRYRLDAHKRRRPQCIAHRGYRAKYAENSMAAFRGAVTAGAHALETDVHVTKDEVVVLSHDPSLKRCFGVDRKIKECTWEEISAMRTVRGGQGDKAKARAGVKTDGEAMPRLRDLLEYLAQPGLEEIWLLLDIKLSNSAEQVMRLIGSDLASVPAAAGGKRWEERVVLGIWAAKFLPLCLTHCPGFPVSNIGFAVSYARHFFDIPNVSFNMLLPMLIAPGGRGFIKQARVEGREVYAWTVNERDRMEWCVRRQLDGVVTDDVELFLAVCEGKEVEGRERLLGIRVVGYLNVIRVYIWVKVMAFLFRKMFRPVASRALIEKSGGESGKKEEERGLLEDEMGDGGRLKN
ncbi:hypothetical protein LTR09_012855 [Extremus antarcticus]|uniref:GP-PDE domain-containing protein n=1 Tax=Extremus antarcticus TaxID=702011 RepID=A0AAJ0D4J6_9PEZI|nr:hypothetical protein LTR09_012855 [Extremus antarcticus]